MPCRNADYTLVWNGLDYTCSAFPVTKVDAALDKKRPPHTFKSDHDRSVYDIYDPEIMSGAPVCLQLTGQPYEEEAVIRMTEVVAEALKVYEVKRAKL